MRPVVRSRLVSALECGQVRLEAMASIVTRAGKGAALTFSEVDANFSNLNQDILARYTKTESDARYPQGVTQTENVFTGNGSQATFTLSQTPPTRESLLVTVDGVVQPVSEYSLSGTALTLSEAPASGAKIRVLMLGVAGPVQSASTLNFAQAGTGAIARTIESKMRDVVSVKDFGAVGDVVANDTAAIQAAIDYAESLVSGDPAYSQAGALVWIPRGKYLINNQLTIKQSGVSLWGEGPGSTAIIATNSSANIIIIQSATAFNGTYLRDNSIKDIWLGGFGAANPGTGAGIYADLTAGTIIENVVVIGKRRGVVLAGSNQGCIVSRCKFAAGNTLTTFTAGSAAIALVQREVASTVPNALQDSGNNLWYVEPNSVHIDNCESQLNVNYDNSVLIESCDGVYISDSYLGFSGGACIAHTAVHTLSGAASVNVVNCFLDTSGPVSGVKISRNSGKAPYSGGWRFANCVISGFGNASATSLVSVESGFAGGGFDDLAFAGCSIANCAGDSLLLNDCNKVRITGCTFAGATTSSISLTNCEQAVITGNTIKDGLDGIKTAGTCAGLVISSNSFDSITNSPISLLDGSTDNVITSNIETSTPQSNTIASAATIDLPAIHDYFVVTGTTNIATINTSATPYRSRWNGRTITLEFLDVLTVEHNAGNIRLANLINITTAARSVLTLRYNHANGVWVQTGWQWANTLTAGNFVPTSAVTPTNGMFLTAANTLAWSTNSLQRARISSAGYFMAANDAGFVGLDAHQLITDGETNIAAFIAGSHASYSGPLLVSRAARSANSAYRFLQAQSSNGSDTEFVLRGDGEAFADGSWTGGGADYAEYFEWSDGNPSDEDRRGIAVVLDGDKIRPALADEEPIGAISGNPSVVGDAAWNKWSGKYLRDDYGSYVWEDYEVEDEGGNSVTQQRRKLNPVYKPEEAYVPRRDRPEWGCVGLMGKLRLRKGQPVSPAWIKMRDISDTVEEWLI